MVDIVDERLAGLYPEHFAIIRRRFEGALAECGFDAIVIGAGVHVMRFLDDQPHPFSANPHLVLWLPLLAHPGSSLIFRPGERPRLVIFQADDYWHKPPTPPGAPWAEHFDMEIVAGEYSDDNPEHVAQLFAHLDSCRRKMIR